MWQRLVWQHMIADLKTKLLFLTNIHNKQPHLDRLKNVTNTQSHHEHHTLNLLTSSGLLSTLGLLAVLFKLLLRLMLAVASDLERW